MNAGAWLAGQSPVVLVAIKRKVLWALVGLGAVGGTWAGVSSLRPAPAPVVKLPEVTTGQEGIAQTYVWQWLRGGGRAGTGLDAYYPAAVDTDPLAQLNPPAPVEVAWVVPIEARVISAGYAAVTVSAGVVGDDASVATHFYRADILRIDRNADGSTRPAVYVATALPFEVPAPLGARLPSLAVGRAADLSAADPMGNRVSRFLAALLTGTGEVTDYTAPGANIRPVRPAPFASVEIRTISKTAVDGPVKTLDVVVSAMGHDRAGRQVPMSYPLELTQRAGRWEVAKLMQAPVLAPDQSDLVVATTLAPEPTTTLLAPSAGLAPTTAPSSTTRPAPTSTTSTTPPTTRPATTTTTTGRNPIS